MSDLMRKRDDLARAAFRVHESEEAKRPIILAIGEIRLWKTVGHLLRSSSDLAYADFADLSLEFLRAIAPDVIVSPLMSRSFDCLDLAQVLHRSEFPGRYRIVTSAIKNPGVLLSEIAAQCPGLDTDVHLIGHNANLSVH